MHEALEGRSPVLLGVVGLLTLLIGYQVVASIYSAFLGPLSKYPGPFIRKFSVLPHAIEIARGEQHRDLARLHVRYGPTVRFGPNHVSFIGSKQTWKEVYGFRKGGVVPKDPLFYGTTINGAHSVATTMDMADHGRVRKIFSNAFSDRALKAQEPMIKIWSMKLAEKLHECADTGKKTDMLKYYNCTTFDIMGDLTFGEPLHMLDNSEYSHWVKTIFDGVKSASIMRSFKFLGSLPSYLIDDVLFKTDMVKKRMMEHFTFTSERVDMRMAKTPDKPDIWSLLENKDEKQGGLTLAEAHSNGNTFMIAGTETTATALAGTTFYLLSNPQAMAKLAAEVRSSGATSAKDLRLEDLAQMKYLHAVLQEGLRLYPPAAIDLPRKVQQGGIFVDGNHIPAGTKVGIPQYATYRMPEHFKNADEFHPERWLGDPDYAQDNLDSVEPFSVGPRNCIGKNLAWHEMRILLATVILEFDLRLLPECNDWVDQQKVYTLWDKNPLWCTLTSAQR